MEQGAVEKKIIEQCLRERRPLPGAIQNAPDLWMGLEFYYIAFLELTSCRPLTQHGEGPVPWTAIHTYAEFYNVLGDQREDLFYHVQQLDHAYLEWSRERTKKELAKMAPKSPSRRK